MTSTIDVFQTRTWSRTPLRLAVGSMPQPSSWHVAICPHKSSQASAPTCSPRPRKHTSNSATESHCRTVAIWWWRSARLAPPRSPTATWVALRWCIDGNVFSCEHSHTCLTQITSGNAFMMNDCCEELRDSIVLKKLWFLFIFNCLPFLKWQVVDCMFGWSEFITSNDCFVIDDTGCVMSLYECCIECCIDCTEMNIILYLKRAS